MAEAQAQRRGGVLSRLVLWLLVLCLLAAVWWLASERNQRRFAWRPDESVLTISKGRFFPLGMANLAPDDPQFGKIYGPLPIPQGTKVSEQEFEDQTELDRALFDLVVPWARADAQKGDEKSIAEAGRLVDRGSALPGLTAEQHQRLAGLRGELAFTAAKQDRCSASWKASKASSKTPPNPNPTPRHPRHRLPANPPHRSNPNPPPLPTPELLPRASLSYRTKNVSRRGRRGERRGRGGFVFQTRSSALSLSSAPSA